MNSNLTPSLVRTAVPFIIGAVVGRLTAAGIEVSAEDAATLASFLTVVFGWFYYFVVRLLERQWPSLGVLLGMAKQPKYQSKK
jgi:hypothetical protein